MDDFDIDTSMYEIYKKLQSRLHYERAIHMGHESRQEDIILDEMDEVWNRLSKHVQDKINAEESRVSGGYYFTFDFSALQND